MGGWGLPRALRPAAVESGLSGSLSRPRSRPADASPSPARSRRLRRLPLARSLPRVSSPAVL